MFLSKPPQPTAISIKPVDQEKKDLIKALLQNAISPEQLIKLRGCIDAYDLSDIIQHIYDLNEKYILQLSAVDGTLRQLDDIKNARRNKRFLKKIRDGFRQLDDPSKKIILAEGDSWFNYPIILTDIIDRISMEQDFAVYSLASGGDWLLNMLTARHYVEELSLLHPDVFLISGGGNDLVGSSRLAAIVEPSGASNEYQKNKWAEGLMYKADKKTVGFDAVKFDHGVKYLSKDFFALLMFFHLQYYFLIDGILKTNKFYPLKILTQGYDYPIPSYRKDFGLNPLLWYVPFIRKFFGHGSWLKTPLMMRGIRDQETQEHILYAMIYLFNEMMIDIGDSFQLKYPGCVFHIDSRGSVGKDGWTDELHPKPVHFLRTGQVFVDCINGSLAPTYRHVYAVKPPGT